MVIKVQKNCQRRSDYRNAFVGKIHKINNRKMKVHVFGRVLAVSIIFGPENKQTRRIKYIIH